MQETPSKLGAAVERSLTKPGSGLRVLEGRSRTVAGAAFIAVAPLAVPGLAEPLPPHGQLSRLVPGSRCEAAGDTGTSGGSASGSRTGERTDSLCKLAARLRGARLG